MSKRSVKKASLRASARATTAAKATPTASSAKATPTATSTKAPARPSSTGASVGSREFGRRAQAARKQTVRKRAQRRPRPTLQRPSLDLQELLRRVPRAAWICALVACLNAICWSIVTPPFQVMDEPSHFAYVQQLAENEALPKSSEYQFSPEENAVLTTLRQGEVMGRPEVHTISSSREQQQLDRAQSAHLPRFASGRVGGAGSGPPLYYALQTIPYGLASSGTLLDQLQLMRLLSALFGGLTALFAFLFIREVLPGAPWAWTVGGLAVALAPMLGYMSGAVNPDAMLFAVSAAVFYCLARAFRRGLTRELAIAIGALTAVGVLTKLNFIGLTPGIVLGLIVLSVRAARVLGRRAAMISLAIAVAVAAAPASLYLLVNVLSNHPSLGIVSTTLNGQGRSLIDSIGYVWQFYLPRLPWMTNHFPGLSMTRQLWFDKSVGFYGWLDTSFPAWVTNLALIPFGLLSLLGIRALVLARLDLRRRLAELAVYGAMAVGLMALIGASAYFNPGESLGFAEPRYLLPLIPLAGVLVALAARGAGRRWGPPVGAAIVVLFFAHDIFSQLLVVGRFYG